MLCCLEERETGPLTADVSVRLVPDMVFTVYTLHCTLVSVRKDKRQISLCTWNPPCSHAMQLCGIGGMMDNSQGQRHNINHCFRRFFQTLIKDFPDNAKLTWDISGYLFRFFIFSRQCQVDMGWLRQWQGPGGLLD